LNIVILNNALNNKSKKNVKMRKIADEMPITERFCNKRPAATFSLLAV
jgi:hypothetical protein